MAKIKQVHAREFLIQGAIDRRRCYFEQRRTRQGGSSVGASTGEHEALSLGQRRKIYGQRRIKSG